MNKPNSLNIGDTIGIIAPASNIKIEMLMLGKLELERLGYNVVFRQDIVSKEFYTAGSVERRLDEIYQMWTDPNIKAIIAARGGYGCLQLLPLLDPSVFISNKKIFIGYSDITAFHLYLLKMCQLITFHGPMAAKDFAGGPSHYDLTSFKVLLEEHQIPLTLASPKVGTLIPGKGTGRIVGGCLSLVASLIGTPWELDTKDSILFLEDTGTKPYQIDRMLRQLKYSGAFDAVQGIVFGEMSDCIQHLEQGYALNEIIYGVLKDFSIPTIIGWRSGHSEEFNQTLPIGILATLDADACTITMLESATC